MTDIRKCPFCAKEMEYDMLSGRFICSECGRSEGAQEMPVKESYRSVSKELERHTVSGAFRGKYEPDDLLRIYARDFGEESVEAVLKGNPG